MNSANCSWYPNIRDTDSLEYCNLYTILEWIKKGEYETQISELRYVYHQHENEPPDSPKKVQLEAEMKQRKLMLPGFTVSGTFTKRKASELKTYSSYIVIDLDNLVDAKSVRDQLSEDEYVYAAFLSARGHGVSLYSTCLITGTNIRITSWQYAIT